jgi:hypothetical protein
MLAVAGLAGAAGLGGLLLLGLAAKERDDRFCIACHLHEGKFTRFRADVASDLAGRHHVRKGIRCIDCHGGADPAQRLRVWAVAGLDTVRFLAGAYAEPEAMRLPLRSEECAQCHMPVRPARRELDADDESMGGSGGDSYHAIRDHDAVDIACARCHTSHTTDSDAGRLFISSARVRPLCGECHQPLSEGASAVPFDASPTDQGGVGEAGARRVATRGSRTGRAHDAGS